MGTCNTCGKKSANISNFLGLCRECIIKQPDEALTISSRKHAELKRRFFPSYLFTSNGLSCNYCGNECRIQDGKVGFCGITKNENGKLIRPTDLIAEIYYDPHPTNCVPMQFCGASGAGYPDYSHTENRELGYYNLSVFCIGCSSTCLYCQNWHYLQMIGQKEVYTVTKKEFLSYIRKSVSCVCFFGGDPTIQLDKIIDYSIEARQENKERILRFCLETNGNFNKELLKRFAPISLESGGGIKFDLKTYNSILNKVLSGVDNRKAYECFEMLGKMHQERSGIPFLRASTLLVPGYITPDEIEKIAEFISGVSSDIPYFLLAFSPQFMMSDLPATSEKLAYESKKKAEKYLDNVTIGNKWLLR